MPWTDKPGGSGSNGGGNGPWGQPSGNGQGGSNGNGSNGNNGPADIEELIRTGRERFRRGRGGGGNGAAGGPGEFKMPPRPVIVLAAFGLFALYLLTGVYSVPTNSKGVVTTFGQYSTLTGPGFNWHLPWPFQESKIVNVTGERTAALRGRQNAKTSMLTSDLNIVDVTMTVSYRVADDGNTAEGDLPNAAKFLFNLGEDDSQDTKLVTAAMESALRQVVGSNDFEPIISSGRQIVERDTTVILQDLLDSYETGIDVIRVNFGQAFPPEPVIPAQSGVIDARSEAERLINEATRYQNDVVPRAAGQAREIELQAEAYAQQQVREANGQARRFKDVYQEYLQAPEVTRERMYLERMETVLGGSNKIILDQQGGGGAVPYLNVNELTRQQVPGSRAITGQGN